MRGWMMFMLVFCAIIGLGAGVLGGLLGISGGIITVPSLIFLFKFYGFPSANLVQLAIGTSLAAMVFNALSSMKTHQDKRAINWKLVKRMLPGLVLGCILGAYLGQLLPSAVLQLIFGCFAAALGIYFYFHKGLPTLGSHPIPASPILNFLGFGVGTLSNILGIGGGTLTVPLFVRLKIPLKASVATSTATGFIISLLGAIFYLLLGLGESYYEMTVGFIYIPAFVVLAVTTFLTAPFGARLAHRLQTHHLKKVFAICLVAIGVVMILHQ
jgi:uncharacterized membrane protein YfcA